MYNPPSNLGSFDILAKFIGVRAGMKKMIEIQVSNKQKKK